MQPKPLRIHRHLIPIEGKRRDAKPKTVVAGVEMGPRDMGLAVKEDRYSDEDEKKKERKDTAHSADVKMAQVGLKQASRSPRQHSCDEEARYHEKQSDVIEVVFPDFLPNLGCRVASEIDPFRMRGKPKRE